MVKARSAQERAIEALIKQIEKGTVNEGVIQLFTKLLDEQSIPEEVVGLATQVGEQAATIQDLSKKVRQLEAIVELVKAKLHITTLGA